MNAVKSRRKSRQISYDDFIQSKIKRIKPCGFEPEPMPDNMREDQKEVTRWAIRQGRCAIFADCGLGKTFDESVWAEQVSAHTDLPVLILAPLAVAHQTIREAQKFGLKEIRYAKNGACVTGHGTWITNYEKLHLFDDVKFGGVALDESSILRNFSGKTRIALTERFASTIYKLCGTATPSPNDFTELGQHAEFLGVCSAPQMLATFFINDTFDTGTWRLKKHAEKEFWQWVSSWACCVSKPSDLGYSDDGFDLPPLNIVPVWINSDNAKPTEGELFRATAVSATGINAEMREYMTERVGKVAELISEKADEQWAVWCNLNVEQDALEVALGDDAVSVRGADSEEKKEAAGFWFANSGESSWVSICKSFNIKSCGNRNTRLLKEQNTSQNQLRSEGSLTAELLKKTESTCEPITKNTGQASSGEPRSKTLSTTPKGENNTQLTSHTETTLNEKSKNGQMLLGEKSGNTLLNTDSQLSNLKTCSKDKTARAQYADTVTDLNLFGSQSLTTAIQPKGSEDYSVATAITDLESSKTAPNCSEPQPHILISKSSLFGYGLNFQSCCNLIYFPTFSFEDFYQVIRRFYRFGQKRAVTCYVVLPESAHTIWKTINRKLRQHNEMRELMQYTAENLKGKHSMAKLNTEIKTESTDKWTMFNGDCVRVLREKVEDESVGFSVFSPPFADLFCYSNDVQDMGNCNGLEEFMEQFNFLVEELHRVTMPGRHVAIHCCDLLSTKWKDGDIGFKNFTDALERAFCGSPDDVISQVSSALMSSVSEKFKERDFVLHSKITIWKSPVTEMQRTKAHGLLYKTLQKDSAGSRVGAPDYLLVFRKKGVNPVPIKQNPDSIPLSQWQELASPVWMNIDQGNVLNGKMAREQADERHVCPLQLGVIENALRLWSASGDVVLSPFAGIGSEGYCAIKMGRKFIGAELKESYFRTACDYLNRAETESVDLFIHRGVSYSK